MFNPFSSIAKGLFKTKVLLKEIRVQIVLLVAISAVTFSSWSTYLYMSYQEIDRTTVLVALKAEFYNWLGLKDKLIDTSATLIQQGMQKASTLADKLEPTNLIIGWESPALIGSTIWLILSIILYRVGKSKHEYTVADGTTLNSPKEHQKALGRNKSDIKIGNVNILKDSEVQHLFIAGSTGTGKSQALHQLILQIRKRGDSAIVIDPKGEFLSKHFREGIDKILSPFDVRSENWNPWMDLTDEISIEAFSEAIIKENRSDPFWSNSSKSLLIEALKKAKNEKMSFQDIINFLMNSEMETLSNWFKETSVASNFASEKTIAGILGELKNNIKALKYIQNNNEDNGFSLNRWLEQSLEQKKGECLFIPLPAKYRVSGIPIAAAQIELFASQILSLKEDKDRRIWIIVDELPSLPQLRTLQQLASEGRSYGVVIVLAVQNYSQLKETYGSTGADAFAGNCNTVLCLRSSDPSTAKYFSDKFGEQRRVEIQKGSSHTKNNKHKSSTDNESETKVNLPTVNASRILHLDDLEGILSCKGSINPALIKLEVQKLETKNESFIPKEFNDPKDDSKQKTLVNTRKKRKI